MRCNWHDGLPKSLCVSQPPQGTCISVMSDLRLNIILTRDEFIKVKIKQSFLLKLEFLSFRWQTTTTTI